MNDSDCIIRGFDRRDREAVRRIALDTAFMGEPASAFFESETIICDLLTLYYTDYEPQSCFVAETNHRVIGTLIGAKNKAFSEKIISGKILPRIFLHALKTGIFLKKKNLKFTLNLLRSVLKNEFKMLDFSKDYPATLHINIEKAYRGFNIGARLIAVYLDYLVKENIPGVSLATMSDAAGGFFTKQGFELLHAGKRSYFRHILHKDVPLYIYGKKLYNILINGDV